MAAESTGGLGLRGVVRSGSLSRGFAAAVIWMRWPIVLAWVVAAVAVWHYFPGTSHLPGSGIYALVPTNTQAFETISRTERSFGTPLLPQLVVVQRNPNGLGALGEMHIVRTAVRADRDRLPGFPRSTLAVPIVNVAGRVPSSRENGTTAVTYLGFSQQLSADDQLSLAQRYARVTSVRGAPASVTGLVAGSMEEGAQLNRSLKWVEIATVAMVALVVGLYFRSLFAPFVTLGAAAVLYVLTSRGITVLEQRWGVSLHQESEPIVVVLLLGVVTDYSVFILSGTRDRLRNGESRLDAVRNATAQNLPIIVTAGLLVATGLLSLEIASIGFVKGLGPGMAFVVVATLLVSITFVPALTAILGRVLLWPGGRGAAASAGARFRRRVMGLLALRWFALPTLVAVAAGLVALATGIVPARLDMSFIRGLPGSAPAHRAATEAGRGFAPGIVSPLEVVVRRPGIGAQGRRLFRFERDLTHVPGVAAAIGASGVRLPRRIRVFRSPAGNAVRYLVVLDHSPFSAPAIDDLRRLQGRMPTLLARAGLRGATVSYAGDTAIARDSLDLVYHDLALVAAAVFAVNLLLLCVFLRSIVAPLYLVCASALSLAATFGVTTYVFQGLLGYDALTFYVPLSAGVLLVAFGSDYNLFVIGRIWQEAGAQDTADAVREAVPRASRAISVAGLVLALSFAMLAIVPLRAFREVAFAVAFGVVLDTFVVRTLLLPSLVTLFGRLSWWPGARGRLSV